MLDDVDLFLELNQEYAAKPLIPRPPRYDPATLLQRGRARAQDLENRHHIRGKRVLAVEDGPTLTHGDMSFGAGILAAKKFGASEIIDPRPYAVGSIREAFQRYPKTGAVLPALGYGAKQIAELEATINAAPADLVLIATPIDLRRIVKIRHPTVRVRYELKEVGQPTLANILKERLAN